MTENSVDLAENIVLPLNKYCTLYEIFAYILFIILTVKIILAYNTDVFTLWW